MTIDLPTLRRWEPESCQLQSSRLVAVAAGLDGTYDAVRRAEAGCDGWSGAAAVAARRRLRLLGIVAARLAAHLRRAATALRTTAAELVHPVQLARSTAMGAAGASPGPIAGDSAAAGHRAVLLADHLDARLAAELGSVVADLGGGNEPRYRDLVAALGLTGPQPSPPTPPMGGPAAAGAWWRELPRDVQIHLLDVRPELIGNLAGLPAAVRDEANRFRMLTILPVLRGQVAALRRPDTGLPTPRKFGVFCATQRQLQIAEQVERELRALAARGTLAQLLTFDLTGAGRVAIGVGDLDQARHVAVLVPGMGQDALRGLPGTLAAASRLRDQAEVASGGDVSVDDVAAVAWTGYAPPGLAQVASARRALAGGRSLADDLTGLAASRGASSETGADPHVTVIGHSYGSTVLGAAAQVEPLSADDVILLGSPGVLAGRADELGVPAGHVFVGEAAEDPVADFAVFGTDPASDEFGATRFRAGPAPGVSLADRLIRAHSGYFDADSESLANIARITVGRSEDITRQRPELRIDMPGVQIRHPRVTLVPPP